jgi:hypothetical protein
MDATASLRHRSTVLCLIEQLHFSTYVLLMLHRRPAKMSKPGVVVEGPKDSCTHLSLS